MGLILSKTVSKLGECNKHNNMSTCEVKVLAQNILDFGI
jgi:hypothetical protein